MDQQFSQQSSWRSGKGQTLWLTRLIDTMEKLSRPEKRALPVDRRELKAVRAHLSRPAAAFPAYGSRFSLRN